MRQSQAHAQQTNVILPGAVIVALVGVALSFIGAAVDLDRFFQVYLVAVQFWMDISLGCLGLLMAAILINGRWAYAIQRFAAAGARTMPLMALLFIPLIFRLGDLYPWAGDAVELSGNKGLYYEEGIYIMRAASYFLIWTFLAYLISNFSYQNDEDDSPATRRKMQISSIIGLMFFFLTTVFAAWDWTMSLNKDWFSSAYGWLANTRQGISGLAIIVIALSLYWNRKPLSRLVSKRIVADLGTLMLVALMLWGYMNVIQYVIIYSGNLPEKANWYVQHTANGWATYMIVMVIANSILFLALVTPGLKYRKSFVVGVAVVLLILRVVEMYWVVMPTYYDDFSLVLWDLALPFAIGGIWVALFFWNLNQHPILHENNPNLQADLREHAPEEGYETA